MSANESKPFVALIDEHATGFLPTSILPISDPCTGEKRQYLTNQVVASMNIPIKTKLPSQRIYEVQNLSHSRSHASTDADYASFFVDSRVVSNPRMHLVTPVDPLYFILRFFEKEDKWQPWNQIVQEKCIPPEVLNSIDASQLKHIFALNDSYGDDMILYKFKKQKALSWLKKKMNNVEKFLTKQLILEKLNRKICEEEKGGAFSSSFRLSENAQELEGANCTPQKNDGSTNSSERKINKNEKCLIHQSAVQIICEYISEKWQSEFLEIEGLASNDISKTERKNVNAKSSEKNSNAKIVSPTSTTITRSFESKISEADKLMQYTMGSGGVESAEKTSKKRKQTQKSVGVIRLAKVNTKGEKTCNHFFAMHFISDFLLTHFLGMKSMTSFFSAKKKKK